MNAAWLYVHVWCSALADKTTSSVELCWPSKLLCPMIASLSARKFHDDVNDSKNGSGSYILELSFSAWICSEKGGRCVRKKEKVWSEPVLKGCAEKGKKCQKYFSWKNFCVAKTLYYLCEEWKDNCWSDVCIVYEQILQNGKLFTQSRNVLIGLEIGDGIMLRFVCICDNW